MKLIENKLVVKVSTIALTIGSIFIAYKGGIDEPYSAFYKSDALMHIGGGMVLMLLWIQLNIFCIATRNISVWGVILTLFFLAILFSNLCGYLHDIQRLMHQPRESVDLSCKK